MLDDAAVEGRRVSRPSTGMSAAFEEGRALGEEGFDTFPPVLGCGECGKDISAGLYRALESKPLHASESYLSRTERKRALRRKFFCQFQRLLLKRFSCRHCMDEPEFEPLRCGDEFAGEDVL